MPFWRDPFGVWRFQWGRGPRRRSAASAVGIPQGPADILVLIVARGCVKQFSCRFTHFAASAVPKAVVWAIKSRSIRASCSARRLHAHTLMLAALAALLPPHSPPNPTFALLAEYRGLPATPPAEHAHGRADLECQCIGSHAASQARRSARATPSDRSLRGERRQNGDDAALMLRRSGSIPGLSCAWDVHASLGLCRSLLPLALDLEKSPDMMGARRKARASRAHPTKNWHWSRIGMGSLCAQ